MKEKYADVRVKAKGYKVEKINDTSETGFITDWEFNLPIRKIDIDDYERRLKKLIDPSCNEGINQVQFIESFSDHIYLKAVAEENNLLRKIFFHKMF
jgi:hypothetical protein